MRSLPVSEWPRFLPCGDAALTVELGENADRTTNARVLRMFRMLQETPPEGMTAAVPAFRSLLVQYDPLKTDPTELQSALTKLIAVLSEASISSRCWLVPVCYEPELGIDIVEVGATVNLTPGQIAEHHASETYYVYMIGFLPGYPYMGDLPGALRLPRRAVPRTSVPKGSVAIAMDFSGIYPQDSPGGWHIIGRTPATLFDARAATPSLLAAGDWVRFKPVSLAEFEALVRSPGGGAQRLPEVPA